MISNDFLTIIFVTILRALGLALGRNWGIFTVCGIIHGKVGTYLLIYISIHECKYERSYHSVPISPYFRKCLPNFKI